MIVGIAVDVTVASIEASTITSISAATTYFRDASIGVATVDRMNQFVPS
jgi:hypothetical protein